MMQLKAILWAAGTLAVASLVSAPASAATMTFQEGVSPTAGYNVQDVMIRSDQPTTVQLGFNTDLIVGKNGSTLFRSLIGFDLTALKNVVVPDGQELQVDSVSLTLSYGQGPGGTGVGNSIDLTLASYAYAFSETTATWNAPGTGAPAGGSPTSGLALSTTGAFDPTPATSPQAAVFGTTNDFEAQISDVLSATDSVFYGILYSPGAEAGGSNSFARIFSSDRNYNTSPFFYSTAVRPTLTVDYSFVPIPEPAGLALLAVGGFALLRPRVRPRGAAGM